MRDQARPLRAARYRLRSVAMEAVRSAFLPLTRGIYGMKASMGRVPLYPGCRDERYPGVSSWETLNISVR